MKSIIHNKELRKKIVDMVYTAKEGHIPSSFSIVDIINHLYENEIDLKLSSKNKKLRDYFILSKGHGAAALYAVLEKMNIIKLSDLKKYSLLNGKLGGHPDTTKIPYVEASTGSLGHGFPSSVGTALALKIKKLNNKVYCLVGDGECHEGTIWESANVASNLKLNNLTVIVDLNNSAKQLMPIDNLFKKFSSFGFETFYCDGHSNESMRSVFLKIKMSKNTKPKAIIAKTIKGYGVPLTTGHGKWHHKIPNLDEYNEIMSFLE